MMILVAMAIAVLIGMTGLAVDTGFVMLERRVLQKAADAAAMSGALDLPSQSTWNNVNSDVSTMVSRNVVPLGTTTDCRYVDNSNVEVQANCSSPTNSTTSGVKVTLTHTRDTYFLRVLGLQTVNVSATAIGRIGTDNTYLGGAALFIVCGINTKVAGPGNNTFDIIQPSGSSWIVNSAAVGKRFVVHGPQITDCQANNNNFKGLFGESGEVTLPGDIHYREGNVSGPTTVAVAGPNGCGVNVDVFNGCVMVLPIASNAVGTTSDKLLHAVMWLPFQIYGDQNQHEGVLIGSYPLRRTSNNGTANWTIGSSSSGIVSVRQVN